MLLIAAILLTNFIIVPLIDLCLNERVRLYVKIALYLIVLAWAIFIMFFAKVPV